MSPLPEKLRLAAYTGDEADGRYRALTTVATQTEKAPAVEHYMEKDV